MISDKKRIRCDVCMKKLGLLSHLCKCGGLFCITHLHTKAHKCTYDSCYAEREKLAKAMIVGPLSDKMTDRC